MPKIDGRHEYRCDGRPGAVSANRPKSAVPPVEATYGSLLGKEVRHIFSRSATRLASTPSGLTPRYDPGPDWTIPSVPRVFRANLPIRPRVFCLRIMAAVTILPICGGGHDVSMTGVMPKFLPVNGLCSCDSPVCFHIRVGAGHAVLTSCESVVCMV